MRQSNKVGGLKSISKVIYCVLFVISLIALHLYYEGRNETKTSSKNLSAKELYRREKSIYVGPSIVDAKIISTDAHEAIQPVESVPLTSNSSDVIDDCSESSIWCCSNLEMPSKSFYGFADLNDREKWLKSCRVAASGRQVLLPNILKVLTSPYDFIDGDTAFHTLQKQADEFLDSETGFLGRMNNNTKAKSPAVPKSYGQHFERTVFTQQSLMNRAPILMTAFLKYSGQRKDFLRGHFLGVSGLGLGLLLNHWERQKASIDMDQRFVLIAALNENWGFLSTTFPDRTAKWGRVDAEKYPALMNFLDDPRLIMLVINQHSNISHPKILTLPRGMPDAGGFTHHAGRMMHDTMRLVLEQGILKTKLLFSVTSAFGTRKTIVNCVQKNVPSSLYDTSGSAGVTILKRKDYLLRSAASRFALAPPGLGYDTFRLWEMMTLGTIPIIEKSIGFDRMVYRMPCLTVEDFAVITPEMLRDAYVEAIYRAEEFEYTRLTQTYWSNIVFQVSVAKSIDYMLERHPMHAEDANLTRPLQHYECANLNGDQSLFSRNCGPGTKRPPRKTCGP